MNKRNMKVVLALSLVLVLATVAFAKNPVAIFTPNAPKPSPTDEYSPYSQAIKYGELVFISGQLALDPVTTKIVTMIDANGNVVPGDITVQTRQVMGNLKAILTAAGLTFDDVLMVTVYLVNIGDSTAFNAVYVDPTYFGAHKPARATIAVGKDAVGTGNIPKGSLLEVSIVAGK